MLKRILFLFALAFVASPLLFAQITTSSVVGTVKNTSEEPLVGATVIATHLPSGTKYTTISRSGGVVNIQNMRVGGPYLIEISFVGHDPEKFEDVYLQLAESFTINSLLKKTEATLENVVVSTARRSSILNPNRTGAVTNIGIRQITQTPSINRSINDLTRATPQSNRNAFGGGNYRQSNFTVDGAEFNNSFGIGTSNVPGGGSPISLDALDEIVVSLTPFDVRQSGFIGAGINAVTRAGTNTFTGSVYQYFRTEKQRGRRVENTFFTRTPEDFKLYGVRIGGPIIKNKLFFFLNFEREKTPVVLQTRTASGPGAVFGSSDNIARPTADSLNYISNYLLNNYGYVTGKYDNYSPNIERNRVMARLDWNISNKNRLVLRYSQIVGGRPSPMSASLNSGGTVAGFSPTTVGVGQRTSNSALGFENSNYLQGENFYSFAGELNSNWGKISNTLRASYTFQDESRTAPSTLFPFVDILSTGNNANTQPNTGLGTPYTSFGYEPFSFNNLRKVKVYSIIDNLSWTRNKHAWTVGAQYDISQSINSFYPFGASYYRFATWADFESALNPNPALRKLPTDYVVTYSLSKNFAPAFPSFKYAQYSVYGQDEITFNRKFKMTIGLRLELANYPKVPEIQTNPLIAALTFAGGEKMNTGVLPKNKIQWSPRIGFNWDLYGDRSLQIRGGTGLFAGKLPPVWVVSQSGNSNMIIATTQYNTYDANGNPTGNLPPGPFNPNPTAYRPSTVPVAGTSVNQNATAASPDFRNPQSWKTTLAMDTKLPWGMVATIEAIFNKDLRTIFPVNINLQNPAPLNMAGYPDNRMIYGATVGSRFINTLNSSFVPSPTGTTAFNPIMLKNGTKGYYLNLTAKIEKPFSKGVYFSVAYSKSIAGNLHDGGGDQLSGVWQGTPTVNGANTSPLSHADYVVPDRVVGLFSYTKSYLKYLNTTISLIYNGSIAGRYSYVYGADINRDGVNGNDLIYIPKDARDVNEISFGTANVTVNGVNITPAQQAQLFEDYILQDKYLRTHRGQYAERNGAQSPWLNRVDLKFAQDIFAKLGKNKNTFQFTVDIFNFGNMLNPSWGKLKLINASSILTPTLPAGFGPGASPTLKPVMRLATANNQIVTRTFRDDVSVNSTYSVQFGIRYLFN